MASSAPKSSTASPADSSRSSSSSAGTRSPSRSPSPAPGRRRSSSPSPSPSPPSKRVRASPAWSTLEAGGSSSRTAPAPSGPDSSSTAPALPDPPLDDDDEIDPDIPRRVITSVSPSGKITFYCPICGAMRDSKAAMMGHVIDRLSALPPTSSIKWSYRYLGRREGYIVD